MAENRNVNTLSYQYLPPPTHSPSQLVDAWNGYGNISGCGTKNECTLVQDKNKFGYRLTYIFVGARRFTTLFRKKSMSAEDLHDIVILLYTPYLVLVPIHITTNSIKNPNLLVSEACLNGFPLSVPSNIFFSWSPSSHTPHALTYLLAPSAHKIHFLSPHHSLWQTVPL